MRRLAILAALSCACAAEDNVDCPGLGCPGDTGTATAATTTGTTASTTTMSATSAATADASTGTETSATSSAATSVTTTAAEETTTTTGGESSTGTPCEGADCPALAECFGLGVWQSCTQYCAALDADCVEAGCDGATVVYYGDVDACVAMRSDGESDQACDAEFMQGGGVSFGRCCCH